MGLIEQQIADYLRDTLGVDVVAHRWEGASGLPRFLMERYRVLAATLLKQPILLLIDETEAEESPANIRKHIDLVNAKCDWPVVYVRERVSAYNRKRLIEQGVAFVVPENQMYLPQFGVDLREYFRAKRERRKQFRPATQAVVIHALLREGDGMLKASELARELGYSLMTLSRAFDEIESAGLAVAQAGGRERVLAFVMPRREVWERVREFLGDPVKGRHFVHAVPPVAECPKAGQSALAHYSMLAEPQNRVRAITQEGWATLRRERAVTVVPMREPEAIEVEVWSYEPRAYREALVVDPLSLYLSMRGVTDERVEQALEKMLERLPW